MNALQTFSFESNPIRVFGTPAEPLFIAVDICKALGLENTTRALERLEADEYSTLTITQGSSNNPELNAVNEAGLYRLVLESRKPEAKAFKRWLLHDVLPSIRKYGGYTSDPELRALMELFTRKKALLKEEEELKSELRACEAEIRRAQQSLISPKLPQKTNKERLVPKSEVAKAYQTGHEIDRFKGASNWRSVKRWWKQLQTGGAL